MTCRTPIATMLACLFLSGCALGPDYQRPSIDLPKAHRGSSAKASAEPPSQSRQSWREVFTDPALQALIDEALTAGPDALLAMAKLREAEALAGVSRAPLLPRYCPKLRFR